MSLSQEEAEQFGTNTEKLRALMNDYSTSEGGFNPPVIIISAA